MFSNIFDIKDISMNYFSSLKKKKNPNKQQRRLLKIYMMFSRFFSDKVSGFAVF